MVSFSEQTANRSGDEERNWKGNRNCVVCRNTETTDNIMLSMHFSRRKQNKGRRTF
jgi:hypothetical protein